MEPETRQQETRRDAALTGMRELLQQGRVDRTSALACPTLLWLVRDGRAERADDRAAAAIAAAVVPYAIGGVRDSEVAGLLFGVDPTTEGSGLGARRIAASERLGVKPGQFRAEHEPRLLRVVADAVLVALAAMEVPERAAGSSPTRGDPTYFVPVRPNTAQESNRLAHARRAGPFVAWRDVTGDLRLEELRAGKPLTIGRSLDNAVVFEHLLVSREHAEVLLRVRTEPADRSVFAFDLGSKHGTALRGLSPARGAIHPTGPLRPVPRQPAAPLRLESGEHDLQLAGEVWMLVGGIPVDLGATGDRDDELPRPTPRERDVLVELCRPQFHAQGETVATPSNALIGALMTPSIGAERVSDLLSQMYVKYGLLGTKEQNRFRLAELALVHGLVRPEDYV